MVTRYQIVRLPDFENFYKRTLDKIIGVYDSLPRAIAAVKSVGLSIVEKGVEKGKDLIGILRGYLPGCSGEQWYPLVKIKEYLTS